MSLDGEHFERDLSERLSRLAAGAGAGPSADRVTRRIRRRTVLRRAVPVGACGLAAIVLLVRLAAWPVADVDAPAPSEHASVAASLIEPLPARPAAEQVVAAVRRYFEAIGVTDAILVDKAPGQPISYAYGSNTAPTRDVEADLNRIFTNFNFVRVSIGGKGFLHARGPSPALNRTARNKERLR